MVLQNTETETVPPPAEDANNLREAFQAWPKDTESIIGILAHRNAAQREKIRETYAQIYGTDLLKDLENKLSGDFKQAVLLWALDPAERDAILAKMATNTSNPKHWILMEIACTRSSHDLYAVRQAYNARFKRSLEEDVACHTSGDLRKLLVPLVKSFRYEGTGVNQTLAKLEAKKLREKILAKAYNDEEIIRILTTSSKSQIEATVNHYCIAFGNEINKDLETGRRDGDEYRNLLRATIMCLTRPEEYFATVLTEAIKGLGTDERTLTRVVTTRAEVDMKRIIKEYRCWNDKSLGCAIKSDTSGDYRKMLLALIGDGDA